MSQGGLPGEWSLNTGFTVLKKLDVNHLFGKEEILSHQFEENIGLKCNLGHFQPF